MSTLAGNLRTKPRSQPFNRSCEYCHDHPTGFGTSELDSKVAKSRASVPKAEISKEHLRAIDEDHQVHDFQITRSARFSLSEVSVSVRAVSRIATFGHSRISLRRYLRRDVHFSTASPCIYKTESISIGWHPDCCRWMVRHLIAISGRRNVPKIGERTCQRS